MEIKKSHNADLEHHTTLFRQLGLVLTLLTVFLAIEHKTYEKSNNGLQAVIMSDHEEEEEIEDFEVEIITQPPPPPPPAPEVIEIVKDEEEIEETIIESTETDQFDKVEVAEIIEVEIEEEVFVEDVPFAVIEEVPIYPGCEKMKGRQAKKDCLNKALQRHVSKKFNSSLAGELGLTQGKKKIYVKFKITSNGSIEIVGARAPHKRLEEEAIRVVNLVPKMTPGKQRGVPVNVNYMLPISFQIE